VLAGLEVVQVLNEHGVTTRRPLAVAVFTNEEGVRGHDGHAENERVDRLASDAAKSLG
jgi:hypothetical protein